MGEKMTLAEVLTTLESRDLFAEAEFFRSITQPAQAVDVVAAEADLVDAGRVLERYEDPRMKPLSEASYRIYDAARQRIQNRQRWLGEVAAEIRRDARAFPIGSFERARLEACADKLTAALPNANGKEDTDAAR